MKPSLENVRWTCFCQTTRYPTTIEYMAFINHKKAEYLKIRNIKHDHIYNQDDFTSFILLTTPGCKLPAQLPMELEA